MIDFSMDEMLELARQAELQKRVEADGVKAPEPMPGVLPEDLRGKLGDQEVGNEQSQSDPRRRP